MVEWMRAHSLHLQPLWDQRNVQDELTTCSFEEYLSQVEQVNAYCGFLEVYALSKGLPANILVIDETAGHHIRFASQSDADPFIVLRFVAKHYEWVRCDAQFAKFLDQGRHELEGIPVPSYCEQTIKRTSAAFRQPVEHFRGILTGAACSLAMQRAMRRQAVGKCWWCMSGAVPCWHHLAWQCPHFLPSRPPTPACALQRRFGWMQHHDVTYGTAVLRHLAAVRQAVLDEVYAPLP